MEGLQYQSILRRASSSAQVADRVTQLKGWIKECDNSSSDCNQSKDIVDHATLGESSRVQADFTDLGQGGFEINRVLTQRNALPLASSAQLKDGKVSGYEVTKYPDGTCRGYAFVGAADGTGPITASKFSNEEALLGWRMAYIKTLHI